MFYYDSTYILVLAALALSLLSAPGQLLRGIRGAGRRAKGLSARTCKDGVLTADGA